LFLAGLPLALVCMLIGDEHEHEHEHEHNDHHDDDHEHEPEHHHEDHSHDDEFLAIDHRLDKLTSRIQCPKDRVSHRTDPHIISQGRSLRARVQKLEGK